MVNLPFRWAAPVYKQTKTEAMKIAGNLIYFWVELHCGQLPCAYFHLHLHLCQFMGADWCSVADSKCGDEYNNGIPWAQLKEREKKAIASLSERFIFRSQFIIVARRCHHHHRYHPLLNYHLTIHRPFRRKIAHELNKQSQAKATEQRFNNDSICKARYIFESLNELNEEQRNKHSKHHTNTM